MVHKSRAWEERLKQSSVNKHFVPSDPRGQAVRFIYLIYLFIYLFGCIKSLLQRVGSSSLTRDQTPAPCIGSLES